ncbi:MAG: M36 family metallopeptidase [Bryobacteraceae bacterium]|nr:M36 family metallopeptidase [Bryobacteraceae bacterium]
MSRNSRNNAALRFTIFRDVGVSMRILLFCYLTGTLAAAELPHHVFGANRPITAPDQRAASEIARTFTRDQIAAAGLPAVAADSLYIWKQYRTQHNGVTHTVYQQQYQGLDVYGATWVVNVDTDGQVINAGGKLYEPPTGAAPSPTGLFRAARAAFAALEPKLDPQSLSEVTPLDTTPKRINNVYRVRAGAAQTAEAEGQPVWFPVRGRLEPAWVFAATKENQIETEEVVVSANTDLVLQRSPMTHFQAPQNPPRGLVFTGTSPQPIPPGVKAEGPTPIVARELVLFTGDRVASPRGWISGNSTAGNNTVTGNNPLGIRYWTEAPQTTSPTLDFQFPLEFGPQVSPTQFKDAAATNLFYWINRAHDLFYSVGFDEAAGNYQQDNFDRGGVGGDPMYVYTHFGSQTPGLADLNNAFYVTRSRVDGARSMVAMYLTSSPGRWADGAYAGDVILHEYTHGVTFRIVNNISGFQGQAMNEAFSDFWALEFLTPEGAPPDGIYPVGEYWNNTFGVGIRSRPYTTNLNINPLTYRDLGRATNFVSIHNDGGIWVMALWEIRANLIAQFGEREGRRRLRLMILDAMKLAPPAPSMVDMRDAVLLADRVNFRGASQDQLWTAFAKRGLGVLAYSNGADTIVVQSSFEKPSNAGVIGVSNEVPVIGEVVNLAVYDGNATGNTLSIQATSSSGDVETVALRRQGNLYIGTLFTTAIANAPESGTLSLLTGDAITIYYNDRDSGSGFRQITRTVSTLPSYAAFLVTAPYTFANERGLGFRRTGGASTTIQLPFEFPYFDRKVNQVTVGVNGSLSFDVTLPTTCYDTTAFASTMAVAPMWAFLRTDGFAQPAEDIYIGRPTPDSISFRWVAETDPFALPPLGTAPEPVNFAATLFQDGRIRFQYGDTGNTSVVNTQPFAGCEPGLPLVGLSRGVGGQPLFLQAYFGRANFRNAPTIEYQPGYGASSLPEVVLEAPAAGAKAPGVLEVRGIVSDSAASVSSLNILIDGVYRGRATTGVARPDYCLTARLPGCPNVGFTASLDMVGLGIAPGSHTLQLRAVNSRGGFTDFPRQPVSFEVELSDSTLPIGKIEAPAAGATVRGTFEVNGYAYGRSSRVSFVEVLVDEIVYGRAAYNVNRVDICAAEASNSPNCPAVGFRLPINSVSGFPALTNGEHRLQIRLLDALGRITLLPAQMITVDNPVNLPPDGAMTEPVNGARVSGVLRVSGYGYDPDGRVTQVLLVVDGLGRAVARYGLPRPEACAGLPDITACPNIGFEVEFDTKILTNGLHRIGIALLDDRGRQVVIPRTTSSGVNVFVEN